MVNKLEKCFNEESDNLWSSELLKLVDANGTEVEFYSAGSLALEVSVVFFDSFKDTVY